MAPQEVDELTTEGGGDLHGSYKGKNPPKRCRHGVGKSDDREEFVAVSFCFGPAENGPCALPLGGLNGWGFYKCVLLPFVCEVSLVF